MMEPDHGASNYYGGPATAAVGTPKPKGTRGRPDGNGALTPKPRPGLQDFGKGKPSRSEAMKA